jgi:hypothetical protein
MTSSSNYEGFTKRTKTFAEDFLQLTVASQSFSEVEQIFLPN